MQLFQRVTLILMSLLLLLLSFYMNAATPSISPEDRTVHVTTLYGYPPYCFYRTGADKLSRELVPPGEDAVSFQGYSWDIVRESFHARGWNIELTILPWARAFANARNGTADLLFPTGKNSERLAYFDYSKQPINNAAFRIYVNKKSTLKWHGLGSLSGKVIGAVRGYNYGDEWAAVVEDLEIYSVNSIEQGFRMLKLGRLDGFAGYETNWDYTLKTMGLQGQFDKLPEFGASREFLTGLKGASTRHLLAEFDAGLMAIKANGTFDQIVEKWR